MKLIKNIHEHCRKLKHSYNSLLENFDMDDIHEYRLEIKKIRALLHLINAGAAESDQLKIKGVFKSFYNSTGEIRNLQLHRMHVTNLCDGLYLETPELYLEKLHQEEYRYQKRARKISGKVSVHHFEKWLVEALPEKVQDTTARDFVMQSRTTLLSLLPAAAANEELLHQARKVLKDLVYNQAFIPPQASALLPVFLTEEKNVTALALTLGNFHDLCITLGYLETFSNAHSEGNGEQAVLNILKEEWEVRKNEIWQEAVAILNHIEMEAVHPT